jgi:hypothetical protein
MKVSVFHCSLNSSITGLSIDRSGSNLPITPCRSGIWMYVEDITLDENYPAKIGWGSTKLLVQKLKNNGFCIIKSVTILSETETNL